MTAQQERRRERRVKLAPKIPVKAKVKILGRGETQYFTVSNLSFGGVSLVQEGGPSNLEYGPGDHLEVLIYKKNLSIKVVAELLENISDDGTAHVRARIIGIDQAGREVLAGFLKELAGIDI